ncbi:receptor-like protein EIX2 isoform X2 [Quercus suber]|uniref:receptor-like protein EIX2 isoform X2 n=1 Tax=Quercus suber TaxID=58331 RepID=UPI0032DF6E5E
MVKVMGGRFLKLLYAFLTLLLHLKPAHGFTSGVGDDSVKCIENERQALLEFKKGFVNGDDKLSSWGSEDEKNCCNWDGVYCNNQTGHVLKLYFYGLRENNKLSEQLAELIHNLSGCVQYSLKGLHLHGNQLKGSVPKSIGNLSALWSLLLGSNLLEGTQIQIANPSGFIGNLALCGPPLTPKCLGDVEPNAKSPKGDSKNNQANEDEFPKCLYIGMGLGFMVGFWGVCGSLMLSRSWRHLYFQMISNLNDWLYVAMIVNIARLQRMFQG